MPPPQKCENPSTYFVQDRTNQEELNRLQVQDHLLTTGMGGVLPECQHFLDNNRLAFRTTLPFLRKWTEIPENYEEIYLQMLHEMQQPDFAASWKVLTIWGTA